LQKKTRGEKSSEGVTLNVKREEKEQKQERNIREGIYCQGELLFSIDIKGEEKDQERKIKSMKTGGEKRELPFSIDVKGGEKHEVRNIGKQCHRGV
jgi:hypothetical protein